MPFSTYVCKKTHFYQELRDLGAFNFVSSQARTTESQMLVKGHLSLLAQSAQNRADHHPQMASHLMHMNLIFQKNMCSTDAYHYKHSEMIIFLLCFNTGKNRDFF